MNEMLGSVRERLGYVLGDVTTDRVGGFEHTAIFMCEPGETQLLCPVEIAFLSSSAG